ncbi:hypothetical protein PV11_09085 [Exophiala sideris]|uniref:Uncharacterized protein n=1 Tax=Exophiala sideris TaxID=1016849 RepID=A0A0D1Y8Y5_9EURO|nr:hypothetical protein PV11_09085 [Exophiala sideris]
MNEYDGPATRTRSCQQLEKQAATEDKLKKRRVPAKVVDKFVDVVNAKRLRDGLDSIQVSQGRRKCAFTQMTAFEGKKCQIRILICNEQQLVIWKWLEAVMSLSAASNQHWEAYLRRETVAAKDHAYLVPRIAQHFKKADKKCKRDQKQSHLDNVVTTALVTDTSKLPMPGHDILVPYLKKMSMDRDELGQAPVVLDYDKNRPVFVDLSGPGLRRPLDKSDIESIWKWCHGYCSSLSASTRLDDKEAQFACREYKNALTRYPELSSFLGVIVLGDFGDA